MLFQLTDDDLLNPFQASNFNDWVQNTATNTQFKNDFLLPQLYVNNYYKAKAFLSLPIIDHIPPSKVYTFF